MQKGCGDYTASTDDLKRVDFNVISVKKEASKPYPTRETPLTGDFDVELDNTGGSTEKSFTKSRTVEATSSQTYSVESGTSSSFTVGASVSAGFESLGAECGWRQPKHDKQTRNETSRGVSQQVRLGTILRVGKTRKPRKTKGDG